MHLQIFFLVHGRTDVTRHHRYRLTIARRMRSPPEIERPSIPPLSGRGPRPGSGPFPSRNNVNLIDHNITAKFDPEKDCL